MSATPVIPTSSPPARPFLYRERQGLQGRRLKRNVVVFLQGFDGLVAQHASARYARRVLRGGSIVDVATPGGVERLAKVLIIFDAGGDLVASPSSAR
jgi:hypothetical protein